MTVATGLETESTHASTCTACGACCAYSPEWPRFTVEDDEALGRLPLHYVDHSFFGMRCEGDRCSALIGQVGLSTSCAVYADRPEVCRACSIGDDACQMARSRHGLRPIAVAVEDAIRD